MNACIHIVNNRLCGNLTENRRCPEHAREFERARGSRSARGYTAEWYKVAKAAIAAQPWCSRCGATSDLTGDHIIPMSAGGTSTPDNCRVLCRGCNTAAMNARRARKA